MKRLFRKNSLIKGVLFFLIALSLFFVTEASAQERKFQHENPMRWGIIANIDCHLEIDNTNGIAKISGNAKTYPGRTNSISVYLELQKKAQNGSWTYVHSYSGTGSKTVKILKTRALHQRGEYRIVMTAVADGEGAETRTCSDYKSYY